MFMVDESTADAIRRAYQESGEISAVVELRRHFPGITDNENARQLENSLRLSSIKLTVPSARGDFVILATVQITGLKMIEDLERHLLISH